MVHPQPHRVPAVRAGLHHAHCSQRLELRQRVHHSSAGCNYCDNSAVCLMAGLRTAFPLADCKTTSPDHKIKSAFVSSVWRNNKLGKVAALFLRCNRSAVQRNQRKSEYWWWMKSCLKVFSESCITRGSSADSPLVMLCVCVCVSPCMCVSVCMSMWVCEWECVYAVCMCVHVVCVRCVCVYVHVCAYVSVCMFCLCVCE